MKRSKEIALALLFLFPLVSASFLPVNCNVFSDWKLQECQNILNDASLSLGQKEELYLNLLEAQGKLASFDFVWNWNKNLSWNNPPQSVVLQNSGIIKNAWLKIIGVNKSYFDVNQGKWFVQPAGQFLSAYNFGVELPVGTESNDCRTNYSYQVLNQDFSQKLNGNNFGSQKLASYSINVSDNANMLFESNLFLKVRLIVEHYKNNDSCYQINGVWYCTPRCLYYNTEYRDYSLNLTDNFPASARVDNIQPKVLLEKGPGLNKLILLLNSDKPINDFELNFGGNSFSFSEANFDLNFSPEGELFITKSYAQNKALNSFLELDSNFHRFVLGTTSIGNCSYKLFSDFAEQDSDCGLIELKPVQLQIETDANSFDFNQQIVVRVRLADALGITLANKSITLQAGSQKLDLITDSSGLAMASIPAKGSQGTIIARFAGDEEFASQESVKRVALFDSRALGTTEQVAGFFGAYYFIFLIAKKFVAGL